MALSKAGLKARIITEFEEPGAVSTGEHSWVPELAEALANAIVDEIQANAKANVTGGSSAGSYSIE